MSSESDSDSKKKPTKKGGKKPALVVPKTEEEKRQDAEQSRLRGVALKRGLLSRSRSTRFNVKKPSKELCRRFSTSTDIIKKSSLRKQKYLFVFPGLFAPTTAGTLGNLEKLDEKNPVLYIDFPQGRMKLNGTLLYPNNKFFTIKPAGKDSAYLEDVFENIVVFSEPVWVGHRHENASEKELDVPTEVFESIHSSVNYNGGAGADKSGSEQSKITFARHSSGATVASDASEGEDETPVRTSQRTPRRATSKSYVEKGSDVDEEDDSDDDDDDVERLPSSQSRSRAKASSTTSTPNPPTPTPTKKRAAASPPPPAASPAKKAATPTSSSARTPARGEGKVKEEAKEKPSARGGEGAEGKPAAVKKESEDGRAITSSLRSGDGSGSSLKRKVVIDDDEDSDDPFGFARAEQLRKSPQKSATPSSAPRTLLNFFAKGK